MRDNKGRFIKGASGNPAGRPARADELRKLLDGDADEVARRVLEAAKGGDLRAAELVLARVVPVHRPAHAPTPFPLDREAPLADQGRAVLAAIADGILPPDQGKALLDALAGMVRIVEQDEVRRRLDALEGK